MSYIKKTWFDRLTEFPTRRRLEFSDGKESTCTVRREEGTIYTEGDVLNASGLNDLEDRIENGITESAPTGQITPFGGSTAPTGWLLCDGSEVSRTEYEALFDVIGITYGVGDEQTTFNLPDLIGRFPLGCSDQLGTTGGEPTVSLTAAQNGPHRHAIYYPGGTTTRAVLSSQNAPARTADSYMDPSGNGEPHNNMPPYVSVTYIIKT